MLEIAGGIILAVIILSFIPLLFTKGFWIFIGILILLIVVGVIAATPPQSINQASVTAISPIGDNTAIAPNCTNPTIQNPCGTIDTNTYPITAPNPSPGTFILQGN